MIVTRRIYLIVFLFIASLNFNCVNNSNKTPSVNIPTGEISVDDFEQKLSATPNAQIIDVRTPEEYTEGHLLSAINIDWNGTDFDYKIKSLDKTKPSFVYCLSGGRSHAAAEQMRTLGFTEIYEMKGGIREWKKSGKSLTTSEKVEAQKETTKEGGDANKLANMNMDDYNKHILTDKLVLVDFNAPWCGPCKLMSPILDEIAKEQNNTLDLLKINSDDNEELSQTLQIANLPTLILYKKGKEVWKHEGYLDKIALMVAIEAAKN
jgi:thioredoxin 1